MIHPKAFRTALYCLYCCFAFAGSTCLAAQPVDPILEWNLIAIDADAEDHSQPALGPEQGGPSKSSRALAIVHAAMYDAWNSVSRKGKRYLLSLPIPEASGDAAVCRAAHDTLVELYPRQKAKFDAALANSLTRVSGSARVRGEVIGSLVALTILNLRDFDRSNEMMFYSPTNLPGRHRPDPLHPAQGFYAPNWGVVMPFAIPSPTTFRIQPPPSMKSAAYRNAFNEVKAYGARNSTVRTADQTNIGLFWAYDGTIGLGTPPRLYNQIVRVIAQNKHNTIDQNARLFALINIAMADAGIACWKDKYRFDFWRPVLGIREADEGTGPTGLGDGNPRTIGDIHWEPLGSPASNGSGTDFTPPFPSYASGHATFGAATFHMVRRFYGTDRIAFEFVSDELNGMTRGSDGNVRPRVVRRFTTLTQLIEENAQSRIYLGVHWKFDATAGIAQGTAIANYIFNTKLR